MTVADALRLAREAHTRYREALPRRVADGAGGTMVVEGDAEAAGLALAEACRYRAEAHVLDAHQADPSWRDEAGTVDHDAVLDFYVAQLSAEPEPIKARMRAVQDVNMLPVDLQSAILLRTLCP